MANLPSNPLPRSPSFQNLSFLADEAVLDILDAQPGPDWSINDYNGGFIYEGIDPNAPGAFPEPVQEEDDLFRGNAFPGHVLHLAASVNPATRFHVLLSAIQAQIKVNYPASIPHFEQCARAFATAQDRGRPGPVSDMTVYVFLIRTATELFDWLVENKELELVKFGWGVYMLGCGFKNVGFCIFSFPRSALLLLSYVPRFIHVWGHGAIY